MAFCFFLLGIPQTCLKMTTDYVVGVRWDPITQQEMDEFDSDGGNSSSRLFERSRIRVLAGYLNFDFFLCLTSLYLCYFYKSIF